MEILLQLDDIDGELEYPIKDLSLLWTELDFVKDIENLQTRA